MEPKFFIEQYTRAMTEELNKKMEQTVIEFLINQGYMTEPTVEAALAVASALEAEGKCIRCEHFMKFDPSEYRATGVFIPFVDTIISPIEREEIYKMLKLAEKGYSL